MKKSFDILFKELRTYNPELMDKEFIVVLSKCDLLDDELKSEYAEEMTKTLVKFHLYDLGCGSIWFTSPQRHDLENTKRLTCLE